jgi:hypothetical protein
MSNQITAFIHFIFFVAFHDNEGDFGTGPSRHLCSINRQGTGYLILPVNIWVHNTSLGIKYYGLGEPERTLDWEFKSDVSNINNDHAAIMFRDVDFLMVFRLSKDKSNKIVLL